MIFSYLFWLFILLLFVFTFIIVILFFKVNQIKKIQCKGGTTQGPSNPTWLKQPQDKVVAGFVFAFAGAGLLQVGSGYYKLATGKGKLPL